MLWTAFLSGFPDPLTCYDQIAEKEHLKLFPALDALINSVFLNQLQEDYSDDQMSIKEYVDLFTVQRVQGGK